MNKRIYKRKEYKKQHSKNIIPSNNIFVICSTCFNTYEENLGGVDSGMNFFSVCPHCGENNFI